MENKTEDFVRGFNAGLENLNQYCNLQLLNDGYSKGVAFPQIFLFSDDDDSAENVEQLVLSRLVKTLDKVLEVGKRELTDKMDEFFAEKIKEQKEKFPNAKIKFYGGYEDKSVIALGEYDENMMYDLLDVVKEDFEYIFDGLKLDIDL